MPHVAHNTGCSEWYTPPVFIEAAVAALGGIDLDPASCEIANRTVGAVRYFTKEDDGLSQPWQGRVWLNPPYSQPWVRRFIEAAVDRYERGEIAAAIVLVNNGTETRWGQRLLLASAAVCFPTGRIRFLDPDGNPGAPLQGQMVAYLGPDPLRFREAFSAIGPVVFPAKEGVAA